MATIYDILQELKETAQSKRDLGKRFEKLMQAYFRTDPYYQDLFSDVWLWEEYPNRGKTSDIGIDIVAKQKDTNELWAIQCKFYAPEHTLSKADLDSFLAASGKKEFSQRLIVTTTNKCSENLEKTLQDQRIPVHILTLHDLAKSPIDWSFDKLKRTPRKQLRPHQITAVEKVIEGLKKADRGKLIMACGTGKTFTSLKIAEKMAGCGGSVLFLVPSIALLSQTLREWTADAEILIHAIAVCSDKKVSRKTKDEEDIKTTDLPFPVTTDSQKIVREFLAGKKNKMTVIFSTYQSLDSIIQAQQQGLPEFDLIICDEAHRTTGVILADKEESYFTKVHNQEEVKSKKRLYMTATPRLYGEQAKSKAKENDIILCSMDDENLYGKELYRLGFGEAVSQGLLSDYKVLVLAVDEKYISFAFQKQLATLDGSELILEDTVKIVGCWNGLSKRIKPKDNQDNQNLLDDPKPMQRAVAFCSSIKYSKKITKHFNEIIEEYKKQSHPEETILECELEHIDGTQNALERNQKLDWLRAEIPSNKCRILSNARCLSEGVDVPALDAVIFFNPRNSQVDVVQAVGRVMRKVEGKKYGYIILPIAIPAGVKPEKALNNNERYKVVWQVLQALRSHDERFNAIVNQLELNKNRPPQINVIGIGGDDTGNNKTTAQQLELDLFEIKEWKEAIYAKIVEKCGEKRYWENWAKDVATIAELVTVRIQGIISKDSSVKEQFNEFVDSLQKIINPSIGENDAIEMLSQHLITKPVFDALFTDYEFTKYNPVSQAMQKMIDALEGQGLAKETQDLEGFYQSVKTRVSEIDNIEGKQKVIIELYDKFFKLAFPKMAERLGIVYTPTEIVDFIVQSADAALKQEFGIGLTDKNVHILDPFTGTGTFIVRLLQSGLIKPEDLERKYTQELHANEILLLPYYIAAVNIETAYFGISGAKQYQPFNGIVLTDTFQMHENDGTFYERFFPENNQRVINQKEKKIEVIIGNPPYSAGQRSENDNNKNLKYPRLDERIRESYVKYSSATRKASLYDSYIRAIRWASNRIKERGIISFVTNGSFIDNSASDGLRKCLAEEFTNIYIFNLRGNARTSGEQRQKEKGNVFGEGTRTTIAIILLVKNPARSEHKIYYHDIGDYLSREQKLARIANFGNFKTIPWQEIIPNDKHDWINIRTPEFEKLIPLGDKKNKASKSIFDLYSMGIKTNRDAWCYNFSRQAVIDNMTRMIDFYNSQVRGFQAHLKSLGISGKEKIQEQLEKFIDNDPKLISWSSALKDDLSKFKEYEFSADSIIIGMYRPYCKQFLYFNRDFNERVCQQPKIFPPGLSNLAICVSGIGANKEFSALMVDVIPNLHLQDTGQCFPLYTYEKYEKVEETKQLSLPLLEEIQTGYIRKENIPDKILAEFRQVYGDATITKEGIFYYTYGILHSPDYKSRFAADLKKMLPRLPYVKDVKDFWAFSEAGRKLAYWHLNYETIQPYPLKEKVKTRLNSPNFCVEKMRFAKVDGQIDKTTIIYNNNVTLTGIPLEAYEYVVNGKSAIEWIMECYQITVDKDSQICNNPNDYSENPRYIIDLVKRIVRVSLETIEIVNSLPPLNLSL